MVKVTVLKALGERSVSLDDRDNGCIWREAADAGRFLCFFVRVSCESRGMCKNTSPPPIK